MKLSLQRISKQVESDQMFDLNTLKDINIFICCFEVFSNTILQYFDGERAQLIRGNCQQQCKIPIQERFIKIVDETNEKVFPKQAKKIGAVQSLAENESDYAEKQHENNKILSKCLIKLVKGEATLQFLKEKLGRMITDLLESFAAIDRSKLGRLALALENEDRVWGLILVNKHSVFHGQVIYNFNKNAQYQDIDKVLGGIQTNSSSALEGARGYKGGFSAEKIKKYFDQFNVFYTPTLEKYLKQPDGIASVIENLKTSIADTVKRVLKKARQVDKKTRLCQLKGSNYWTDNVKENIVIMMAYIFAIWTLQKDNVKHYHDVPDDVEEKEKRMYLFQPKPAQVVALLRLLCIDDGTKLSRSFVEIGTGEGKSVTLAVASCILALIGFKVNCVCYSKYLSRRDYDSFSKLFTLLGVSDDVEYGTLHELCDKLITDELDIRGDTVSMLRNDKKWNSKGKKKKDHEIKPTVLLFDEVDVLFSDSFFGQMYGMATSLRSDEISKMTDWIWNEAFINKKRLSMGQIKNCNEYRALKEWFGASDGSKKLQFLENEMQKMIWGVEIVINMVNNNNKRDYITRNNNVCYKQFDSYDILTYGHETMFTYYYELEMKNAEITNIDWQKCISVTCCRFSYVDLVKRFNIILGVTGTLKDVVPLAKEKGLAKGAMDAFASGFGLSKASPIRQQAIEDIFEIEKYTYMPTLYKPQVVAQGQRHRRPVEMRSCDIILCEEDRFNKELFEEIGKNLTDAVSDEPRCVFVFFENIKELRKFDNCHEFSIWKNDRILLIEELTNDEKQLNVTQSCMAGSILLSTKSFGRGTDFHVKDERVAFHGGPHVIQTFFSDDRSEETQIKGRTARQGGSGSYSMVLKRNDLMKQFDIKEDELKAVESNESNENARDESGESDESENEKLYQLWDENEKLYQLWDESENENEKEKLYELLDEKRNEKFEKSFGELVKRAKNPPSQHEYSVNLMNALKQGDEQQAMENVMKLNP